METLFDTLTYVLYSLLPEKPIPQPITNLVETEIGINDISFSVLIDYCKNYITLNLTPNYKFCGINYWDDYNVELLASFVDYQSNCREGYVRFVVSLKELLTQLD